MNTIIINEKDFNKIVNYEGSHYFENFIFNEFRLISKRENYKMVYKIKMNGNIFEVKMRRIQDLDFKECEFIFAEEEDELKFIESPHGELVEFYASQLLDLYSSDSNTEIIRKLNALIHGEMIFISAVKQYIMNESYERKTIQKESCKNENCISRQTKSKNTKTVKQFLLNDIVEYVSHSGRNHNINCECWVVRGHFRHYKNGRVTWISAYEKGKSRNSNCITNKIYVV